MRCKLNTAQVKSDLRGAWKWADENVFGIIWAWTFVGVILSLFVSTSIWPDGDFGKPATIIMIVAFLPLSVCFVLVLGFCVKELLVFLKSRYCLNISSHVN